MRLKVVYRVASVLVISQLRSTRRAARIRSMIARPLILGVVDVAAFVLTSLLVSAILNSILDLHEPSLLSLLPSVTVEGLTAIPLFVLSGIVTLGILYEVSVSAQFASADTVNFLPVTSSEYVLASSLSITYVYSPVWAICVGATLPLALAFGFLGPWLLMFALSFLALTTGGIMVEMLRAAVNRVSSAFYKRGGRSVIVGRLVITVAVIALFQLLVNPNFLLPVIEAIARSADIAWFLPFAWYSVAIQTSISGEFPRTLVFAGGSLILGAVIFLIAVRIRSLYWVPSPVTVRVTSAVYRPNRGILGRLGFSQIETAVIRKDLRSLTRRREMARFLAIPIVVFIPIILPFLTTADSIGLNLGEFLVFPLYMGLVLSALLLSMTSIGAEGRAVMNLYSLPMGSRDVVRAKASVAILVTSLIAAALVLLLLVVLRLNVGSTLLYYALIVPVIIEQSMFGLVIGTQFPDFSEGPRSRYVGIAGTFIGMLVGTILAVITLLPVIVYLVFAGGVFRLETNLFISVGISLSIALIASLASYRLSIWNTRRLLTELPT